MTLRYSGPRGKGFSGDTAKAASLQRTADLLVGSVVDRLKAPPFNGKGMLVDRRRMADGSWIHVLVNMIGMRPIVRTWIESPVAVETAEEQTYLQSACGFVFLPTSLDSPNGPGNPYVDPFIEMADVPYQRNGLVLSVSDKDTHLFRENITYNYHGNVDWISSEGEALTFWGPATRYLYQPGQVTPGTELAPWPQLHKPSNEIYINGRRLHREESGYVNGCALYTTPNGARWLIYTRYRYATTFHEGIVDLCAGVWRGEYPIAGVERIATIDCSVSGTAPDWAFNYMKMPRTITVFKTDGSEGAYVLADGTVVTFTITGEESLAITYSVDAPSYESAFEITRYQFSRYYEHTDANGYTDWGPKVGAQVTTDIDVYARTVFWDDIIAVSGSLSVDSLSGACSALFADTTPETMLARSQLACSIPIAVDYQDDILVTAYVDLYDQLSGSVALHYCVKDGYEPFENHDHEAGSGAATIQFNIPSRKTLRFKEREYKLNHYVQVDRTLTNRSQWPDYHEISGNSIEYADASCIRYMDLRHGCIFFAYDQMDRITLTRQQDNNGEFVSGWREELTATLDRYARLSDELGPGVQLWEPKQRQSSTVETLATYTSPVRCGVYYTNGSTTDILQHNEETPHPQDFIFIDGHTYFGPLSNPTGFPWAYTAHTATQNIAYSCAKDRLVSIADINDGDPYGYAYWRNDKTINQLWMNGDTRHLPSAIIDWKPFATLPIVDSLALSYAIPANMNNLPIE